jgi:hypothetical protein
MMVLVLFTGGCTAGNYVFSGGMGKHKIEVHATDGAYGESYDFAVGRNQKVVLKPDLSEGELQIDFAPATVIMTDPDTPEDVIIGEVLETVKVAVVVQQGIHLLVSISRVAREVVQSIIEVDEKDVVVLHDG